jgi:hypothetical protein
MANISIHGRVIDERGAGIAGLTVRALDFDPFFSEDDVLGVGKTEGDGTFLISYSPDAYRTWKVDRNPDLVAQIFGPRQAQTTHRQQFGDFRKVPVNAFPRQDLVTDDDCPETHAHSLLGFL